MKKGIVTIALYMLVACGQSNEDIKLDARAQEYADSIVNAQYRDNKKSITEELHNWEYSESKDEMSGKTNYFVQNTSSDVVNLDFPYEGETSLSIVIRNNDGETDAYIIASQGQLITDYSNSVIEVKFDESPSMMFSVTDASDGDAKYKFFSSTKKLIEKLKSSKKVKIRVQFYNEGFHVYNFDTKDLNWKH